jgi:hypothetical protein
MGTPEADNRDNGQETFVCFFFSCGTGDWTGDLTHTRQAFYYGVTPPSPRNSIWGQWLRIFLNCWSLIGIISRKPN